MTRIGDAGFDLASGHADLVDQFAMLGYERMFRVAAQDVDRAAFHIAVFVGAQFC